MHVLQKEWRQGVEWGSSMISRHRGHTQWSLGVLRMPGGEVGSVAAIWTAGAL